MNSAITLPGQGILHNKMCSCLPKWMFSVLYIHNYHFITDSGSLLKNMFRDAQSGGKDFQSMITADVYASSH